MKTKTRPKKKKRTAPPPEEIDTDSRLTYLDLKAIRLYRLVKAAVR